MIFKDQEIDISRCKMFKGIPYEEPENTFKQIHYQIRSYEKGQYIILRNDIYEDLLILVYGTFKAEIKNFSDTTVKIADIQAPDSLASAFLFGETNRYPVDASAATDVQVLMIPRQEVLKMLQINSQFLKNFLDRISTRTQYLTDKMKFLSFQTIQGKLAYYFLKTANEPGKDEFKLGKTQQEMSEMFGVKRPSLARTMKQLIDEEFISIKSKTVKLTDKNGLASLMKYEDRLHK